MSRLEHNRYDVEAYLNIHNEIEIKVYDHKRHKIIGHLVEADPQPSTVRLDDGYFYANVWAGEHSKLDELCLTDPITLKKFQRIERDAPEDSENTLYWDLTSDGFGWYRHPLSSWEVALANEDGLMAFEAKGNTHQWLLNHFAQLEQWYMDEVKDEFKPNNE